MNLNFNTEIFNNLFFILKKYYDKNLNYILCRGGAGRGKSYAITQFLLYLILERNKQKFIIFRKTQSTLKDSVINLFLTIIDDWGLSQYFEYNKSDFNIRCLINNNIILFKGLDQVDKIKSISGLSAIMIEEASEITREDFEQLNLRLRGEDYMKIILAFNPVSQDNWIYERFYEEYDRDKCLYTKTTYINNKFINKDYKEKLNYYKKYDFDFYKIYALGEWGNLASGGEAYKFKDSLIYDNVYDPDLPLHISFDENVVPYISCIVAQVENKKVNIIKEYTLKDPENNIYDLTNYIKKDFSKHNSGMFIYGDATSRKRDTKIKNGENFFSLICNLLKQFNPTMRVPSSNPGVKSRIDWINQVIALNRDGINITINSNCIKLIEDLQNVKEASDGTKLKAKTTDKKTKVRFEKYGHLSDCLDYFLCKCFIEEYNIFKNGGKVDIQIPEGIYDNNRFAY